LHKAATISDSYKFFVVENESTNKIVVLRHIIFEKIEFKFTELKVTKNNTSEYF